MSWKSILHTLNAAIIVVLLVGGFYLIPPVGAWVRSNPPFFLGALLGSILATLSVFIDPSTRNDARIAFIDSTSAFWFDGHEPQEVLRSRMIADFRQTFMALQDEGYKQPKPITRFSNPVEDIRTALIDECAYRWENDKSLRENLSSVFVFTAFLVEDDLAEKYKGRLLYLEMEPKSDEDEAFTQSLHAEEYRLIDVWKERFGSL